MFVTDTQDTFKYIIWIPLIITILFILLNEKWSSIFKKVGSFIIGLKNNSGYLLNNVKFFLNGAIKLVTKIDSLQVVLFTALTVYIILSFYISDSPKIRTLFGGMTGYIQMFMVIIGAMLATSLIVLFKGRDENGDSIVNEIKDFYKPFMNVIALTIIPTLVTILILSYPSEVLYAIIPTSIVAFFFSLWYINSTGDMYGKIKDLFKQFKGGIAGAWENHSALIAFEIIIIISYILYKFFPNLIIKMISKKDPVKSGIEHSDEMSRLQKQKFIDYKKTLLTKVDVLKDKYNAVVSPDVWDSEKCTGNDIKPKPLKDICENLEKIKEVTGKINKIESRVEIPYNKLKTTILLNEPVYTNKSHPLKLNNTHRFNNYNYCLSSWVFIHQQTSGTSINSAKEISLLNFANKPNILFNVAKNMLKIKIDLVDDEKEDIKVPNIPLQRWNNIIINYTGGTLDVFINSKLISSVKNILPKMGDINDMTVGHADGVSGGVCNVTYFPRPLTLSEIIILYKSLELKSPPIV
jgi:hypothetical protein